MSLAAAEALVAVIGAYLALGVPVALVLVTLGAARIDPAARNMSAGARLLILPGAVLLWPLMLVKLVTQKAPPVS